MSDTFFVSASHRSLQLLRIFDVHISRTFAPTKHSQYMTVGQCQPAQNWVDEHRNKDSFGHILAVHGATALAHSRISPGSVSNHSASKDLSIHLDHESLKALHGWFHY